MSGKPGRGYDTLGVDVLVFSKDRPAQLDLLLRSIREHASTLYRSVVVLWRASAPEYDHGYRLAIGESHGCTFWREYAFEQNVRWWLGQAGPQVSFLCDDDVFYRSATPPARLPWSLRGGDYDYPFSVDGNIYERFHVETLLAGVRFTDPTELEARAHEHRERLPFTEVHACCPPCLVGVPANRVSTSSRMPHMGLHEYELNERFLKGDRIGLDLTAKPDLPAHADLEYVWIPAVKAAAL